MIAWRMARNRLRRHPIALLSHSLSIAIAVLALLAIQTISSSSQSNLAQFSLNQLSPGDRHITISSNRVITSASTAREIDNFFRTQLYGSIETDITQELLYHQISDEHGNSAYFGGVDLLSKRTSLISGRQPRICHAVTCEVLQIGGIKNESQLANRFGLTIVGHAKIIDSKMFSGTYSPDKGVVLFTSNGVVGASSISSLSNLQGSNGWVASINLASLRIEGTDRLLKKLLAFENDISTHFSGLSLTWPSDSLSQSQNQTHALNQKLGILYYTLIIIFLAFQVILARLRVKEFADFHQGIVRIGARKKHIIQTHLLETAAPMVLGLLFSTILAVIIRDFWWNAGAEFRIHPNGLAIASLGSIVLFVSAVTFASQFVGNRTWNKVFRYSMVVTLLLLTSTFTTSRGIFTTELTTSFWLTALAYIFCIALSVFLIGHIVVVWRKNHGTTFLLAQEGMRTWQGVSAILGISIALTLASLGYQRVVQTDIRATIAEQVPLDLVLRVGPALIKPLDIESLDGYSKKVEGSRAWSVLRIGGSVRNQGSVVDSIPIIGIAPNLLPKLPDASFQGLQSILSPRARSQEVGIPLGSARSISITLEGISKAVDLVGWLKTPQNLHFSVMSPDHGSVRTIVLPRNIPSGSTLTGLEFHETSNYLSRRLHALGEGKYSVPSIKGTGHVLAMSIDEVPINVATLGWLIRKFPFEFDGASVFIWPPQPMEMARVIADPITAALASDSILTLSAVSQDNFKVKIVAVRKSFPSAGNRFVIVDFDTLQKIVGRFTPGAIDPTEVWISTPKPLQYAHIMDAIPYSDLEKIKRLDIEGKENAEPARRGINAAFRLGISYTLALSLLVLLVAPFLWFKENFALFQYLKTQGASRVEIISGLRRVILNLFLAGAVSGLTFGLLILKFVGK